MHFGKALIVFEPILQGYFIIYICISWSFCSGKHATTTITWICI